MYISNEIAIINQSLEYNYIPLSAIIKITSEHYQNPYKYENGKAVPVFTSVEELDANLLRGKKVFFVTDEEDSIITEVNWEEAFTIVSDFLKNKKEKKEEESTMNKLMDIVYVLEREAPPEFFAELAGRIAK